MCEGNKRNIPTYTRNMERKYESYRRYADKGLLQNTKENNVQMKSRRIPQLLMSIRIPTLRTLMLCIFGYVGVVWLVYYCKSFFFLMQRIQNKLSFLCITENNISTFQESIPFITEFKLHCSCTFKGIFHIVCFSHHGQSKLLPLDLSQFGFPSKQQVQNSVRINFPIYIIIENTNFFFQLQSPKSPASLPTVK